MTDEPNDPTETPKPKAKAPPKPKAVAKPAAKPKAAPKPKASAAPKMEAEAPPAPGKVEKLAEEALDAGRPLTESETGRKVVETAEQVFDKAEELVGKARDSDAGKKVAAVASDLQKKALETDLADKALASEAGQTAKKAWNTPLGRNVGVGAAAGAALGLLILNPFVGAALGGGLGYLASLAKKNKKN